MLDKFRETAITWDKASRKVYESLRVSAGDNKGRKLSVQVVNDGVIEDLSGASLSLFWETRDKAHKGLDAFTAVDATKGEFEIYYTTGMLSNEGTLNANLVLVDTSGRIVSEPFTITVFKGIDDDAIQSSDSFTTLTQALIDVSNLEQNYAPRLSTLEQNDVSLSQQLQQNASFHASRFIGKLDSGVPATVVFLGDSTTEQNNTTNGQPNHVGLLKSWLESKYGGLATIVNAGISGNSISQMLGRLNKDVLSKNPDLVIICSSINDAIGTNKISVAKYTEDYSRVIELILAENDCDIIIRTPNRVINPVSNTAIDPFVEISRTLASKYSVGLFDLYKKMAEDVENGIISMTVPTFFNDGIHPNENGQRYIFEKFKPFFLKTSVTLYPVDNYRLISGLKGFRPTNTGAIEESLANAINGKVVSFNTTNRSIETTFIGGEFTVFYVAGENTGQFIVYIDGVANPVVDTYSLQYEYGRYVTYQIPGGEHTIKIENQPTKNASSSGNRIMIEGIVFKKKPLTNDVITPHGFVFLNQSVAINLQPSTNQYFLYNGVTDNSDIIDHNLSTGDVTVKVAGLYDFLYSNRITADPESNVVVGHTKNGVIQKQAYDFFPSGTGKKSKTVDLVETLELVAGDVIRFFVNVGGTSPTTISNAKISIKK